MNNKVNLSDTKLLKELLGEITTYSKFERFIESVHAKIIDTLGGDKPNTMLLVIDQHNELYSACVDLGKSKVGITDRSKIKISSIKKLSLT